MTTATNFKMLGDVEGNIRKIEIECAEKKY